MGRKKKESHLQNTLDDYKEIFALQADHEKSKITLMKAKEKLRKPKPECSEMKANLRNLQTPHAKGRLSTPTHCQEEDETVFYLCVFQEEKLAYRC